MTSMESGNQLIHARSAYLRSAAHQPVCWHEWGEAAFERARRENKPILLDIGAVWCHWCHVMDGESYENETIARIINENFIAIKVDRDERPDIDSRMQVAVQAVSGQGGWPLTAFLTPQARPFFGGTYFPPDERYGRPGFKQVLLTIAQYYRQSPAEILEQSDKIAEAMASVENTASPPSPLSPQILRDILNSIVHSFDVRNGGFGTAPKFPHCAAIDLLLHHHQQTGEAWALSVAETTLTKMARGGVYDHVGGGFHRYSTDEHWTVPHFEKMSYDNSELLKNYLHAYQVTGNKFFFEVAEDICSWVETVLSDPDRGGYYASQDADVDLRDDGDYFTWTVSELQAAVPAGEFEVLRLYFGIEPAGDMHHNPEKNVIEIAMEPSAIAERLSISETEVRQRIDSGRERLRRERLKRQTPFVDTTLYTNWNAMMISASLEAWKVMGRRQSLEMALKSLHRILAVAYKPGLGMYHSVMGDGASVSGLLEDQVQMANALLDAYEVTLDRKYFDVAEDLMKMALQKYWDPEHGGFFDVSMEQPGEGPLASRRKPLQDSPTPAANPVAAIVLERLFHLTENPSYREKSESLLKLFGTPAARYGLYAATYGLALALYYQAPTQVLVVAEEEDEKARALLEEARKGFRIGMTVLRLTPSQITPQILPGPLYSLAKTLPAGSTARAFVCSGFTCSAPVDSPAGLAEILTRPTA